MEIGAQGRYPAEQIRDAAEELPPGAAPRARTELMVSQRAPHGACELHEGEGGTQGGTRPGRRMLVPEVTQPCVGTIRKRTVALTWTDLGPGKRRRNATQHFPELMNSVQ